MSIPTLTVRTGVGLALLPCVGQPKNFTPDTFALLLGAAVSGLTENTGTVHDVDRFERLWPPTPPQGPAG